MDPSLQHLPWLLTCTALVFLMQAGFCCLETGLVRAKNSINVAIKNLVDFCVAGLLFWCFGYAVIFGVFPHGVSGTTGFLFDASAGPFATTFFLFQLTFCGAAATVVSGAVAERMKFSGYLVVTVLVSAVIYPLFGHWAWGGAPAGRDGWLGRLGFVDFAGSTVVHSTGGWVALAACLVVGPRTGRFNAERRNFLGHNLPVSALGVFLLWLGWFGFNGGSALAFGADVPVIILNTVLAGMAGGLTALVISWSLRQHPDALQAMNGVLAGLVGITASCHVVSAASAVCIGAIAGAISFGGCVVIARWKIDDVVGAVPVHGFCGVWGTVAVALFADSFSLGTGLTRWEQLLVQLLGAPFVLCGHSESGIAFCDMPADS